AHQYADIRPDIITTAKGMGNGVPIGGVIISPMFKPTYGMLGTTFGGNHLACTAAIAVLDVIEQEHLMENALRVGNYLINELQKFSRLKEVRGKGLMIGIEFDEPVKKLRERLLFEKKIFTGVSGSNIIRLLPPLCLTMQDAELFLDHFAEVIK
ncbi:MAG TPA: aminotransferase class III-fold pyridoxal phosphate-dependent enzyme, partial [Paludibacteraceae bacterium]|nr:aminotransferase class III-fold pyridoxal phosphate-dependent enzyme [Paludibacteraceae bacterium]